MTKLLRSLTLASVLLLAPSLASAQAPVVYAPAVRVQVAPPPLRVEVRPPSPSPQHIWTGGAWNWQGGKHVWVGGRWEAPRAGHLWVDSHWAHEGGQWGFYQGRWVASEQPYHREVYAPAAPPPPRVEVVPPMHEPRHEWIGGHHEWHGGAHVWMPGRYEERPAQSRWEDHRWERTEDNRYHFRRGGWRHE